MKTITSIYRIILTIIIIFSLNTLSGQNPEDDIILKAMKDELARNMQNLELEGLQKPFFISYTVCDAKSLIIKASLGSIVLSDDSPNRRHNVRVMTGSYQQNNENFYNMNNIWGSGIRGTLPLENNYDEIRRTFWYATDSKYKDAAETYEAKLSSIKQQNLPDEIASIPDFSKAPVIKESVKPENFDFNKTEWENRATELSKIFAGCPDIFSSCVSVYFYNARIFFTNSEGTEVRFPFMLAALYVNAYTQAEDGEPLNDHILYYSIKPGDIPADDIIKKDIASLIENLKALRTAKVIDESYAGPVMFEDQAVAELFAQRFFSDYAGLIANRKPIVNDPNVMRYLGKKSKKSLEDKMGRRVIANEFTVKATPGRKTFNNTSMIGSFEIDAEGVKPDKELVLVEKGLLKNLLNGRVPTKKINSSNGHKRIALNNLGRFSVETGPGVIEFKTSKGLSYEELKNKLKEAAIKEGLDYAYIIRKMITDNPDMELSGRQYSSGDMTGKVSKPVYIYRISLKDGKEELVRSASITNVSVSAIKRIIGASEDQIAYNRLLPLKERGGYYWDPDNNWKLTGIPASFIVPYAIVLEELEIEKEERAVTTKLPVVSNPVAE